MMAPPALRPAVVVMLAMLAAPGKSILRNTYSIARGYENFAHRLVSLGADIEQLSDI
jgi:UDP-N-acetylglucosamine 1-carboxyvinyltransferase